ncbi:shikimate dehydrogenase, partial [Kutzneria sp. 744]|uniref:shikimate dehydrogenase family protein n=1 Tax=Kutzneria sp. (strain 744) TaxID=345341 RepID=UPI0035104129
MDGITGSTRLYAVVGDPVRQVRAPGMLNTFFARAGIDAVLVPVHVRPADLAATVLGLQLVQNLDGLLITVPHKVAVRDFADAVSPAVELSGSANAMRREPDGTWYAENFDGAGFLAGLLAFGHDPVFFDGHGGRGRRCGQRHRARGADRGRGDGAPVFTSTPAAPPRWPPAWSAAGRDAP